MTRRVKILVAGAQMLGENLEETNGKRSAEGR